MVDQIKKHLKPCLLVALLFAVTAVATLLTGAARYVPTMPVREQLPERVGPWQGVDILFCQEESCGKSFEKTQLQGNSVCSVCGGNLDSISPIERRSLPKDSIVLRKRYKDGVGDWISVAVVVSGQERSSIHRPEWCLPGQGLRIVGSDSTRIAIRDGSEMPMNVLDLSLSSSSPGKEQSMVYVYWFHSISHDTASQFVRLGWMAWDNIVHGATYRWAYVMVVAPKNSARDMSDSMTRFLSEFWVLFRSEE